MNHKTILIAAATTLLAACATNHRPVDLADPMVGTGFHGHTFPGATTPFGAVQLSPDTRVGGWDAASGYHYSDNTIDGFSHTHLSGTGCTDLGDILFRPTTAAVDIKADTLYRPAAFSHSGETARPGYYSVKLDDEDIFAELTATTHTGVHRYTFPKDKPATVIVDLDHALTDEKVLKAEIGRTADNEISGVRITNGWVDGHHVYFTARFSRPFTNAEIIRDGHAAVLTFDNTGDPLVAVVGISPVSAVNAAANIDAEVKGFDFDAIAAAASETWENALGVIAVEGATEDQQRNFYSALYHTMVAPNITSDVNGQYRRNNDSIATATGRAQYSTLSLWDTYRAWHPLMTIINPTLVCDMINSMLDMYDATGELPIWPLASGETGTMIGYHSVSVIADAYLKGYRCFDADRALKAMIASTGTPRKGGDLYAAGGYIPSNSKSESVSCTLEYAYDDWCIARMAEAMGRDDVAREYYKRAGYYANVFDGSTRFFRGRRADGNWQSPFNPLAVSREMTEATPWQYRFAAVHDVNGMISLHGGKDAFVAALDSIFTAPGVQGDLVDITGLIGQYSHGNEPSHHIAYLYDYVGEPWKTQEMTRRLLDEMYQPTPEGISGNEDCGQMSAWYVMTALGLYPVAPGSNEFALTSPIFEKATLRLPSDTTLVITANAPTRNKYISSVSLNGTVIDRNYLTYDEIMGGGTLDFTLTDKPDMNRGTSADAAPYSLSREQRVATPYIDTDVYLFTDSISVAIGCNTPGATIHYTLDGTEPTVDSPVYTAPLLIDRTEQIRAIGVADGYLPSPQLAVTATKAVYQPALAVRPTENGVKYAYYEGLCKRTADITKGKLCASGTLPRPSIDSAKQEDHYGFIFEGYINVPAYGIYTFRTRTDDGSCLYIDDVLVVNNDGGHAPLVATGQIPLRAGIHKFRLPYFEDYEGQHFEWGWKLPDADSFTEIPDEALFVR